MSDTIPLLRLRSLVHFLLLLPWYAFGQSQSTIHYTTREGLPSSTVYSVAQDGRGFMWFGTEAGLARFDGSRFQVFTTRDGLPDNEVLGVSFEAVADRLWVVTYKAEPCYFKDGSFHTIHNDSLLRKIKVSSGDFINLYSQPGLGVFLNSGYDIFRVRGDRADRIIVPPQRSQVRSVHQWNDSLIDVMIGLYGMMRHTAHADTLYQFFCCDSSLGHGKWIGGRLFMYRGSNISVYDGNDGDHYSFKGDITLHTKQNPLNILQRGREYLISIVGTGVYTIDTALRSEPHPIWHGRSNDIGLDQAGNIWITTADDGVYVMRNNSMANYQIPLATGNGNLTAMTFTQHGQLYCGSSEGHVYQCDGDTFRRDMRIPALSHERVRSFATYDEDKIFMITSGGMAHFGESGTVSVISHWGDATTSKAKFWGGGPKSLLGLADGHTILVGMLACIGRFDTRTGQYAEFPSYRRVTALAQHPDGRVFCGSLDGVYLYRPDRDSLLDRIGAAGDGRITSLCFTPDSLLWVGTPSSGIWVYDGHHVIARISSATDLRYHGAICRKIAAGRPGTVWIATNGGADQIRYSWHDTLQIEAISPFTAADGLLSDDVNDVMVRDSLVYLATASGLTTFDERQLMAPVAVPVYITSILINDKDSTIHDAPYLLTHLQNNLRIEYVGVQLPSATGLRYRYRLLGGGDDSWAITANTSIEFRSLAPGSYTFEVMGLDKFGNPSASTGRVRFEISPAFYNTIWFWAIVMISILTIGFLIIRDRFRRQQARFEKEQSLHNKIIELEQQALKAQMNPHFIFNCLTAVQHFVNREDMYSANMYLSNFARLIRKTLDLSGEQYISLDEEVAYLQDYVQMESLRFGDKFTYEIRMGENVDGFSMEIPPMLLQPIVENAIRHGLRNLEGRAGRLLIDFAMQGDVLYCSVDDNGIGRQKAREMKTTMHVEYQSKGMALTEQRILAINQMSDKKIRMDVKDKYDDNNQPDGTLFILTVEQ